MRTLFYPSKPSFKAIFSTIIFVIVLVTMPVGVYLVSQNQDPRSRASQTPLTRAQNALILESDNKSLSINQQFTVNLLVEATDDPSNIFIANIKYPQQLDLVSVTNESSIKNIETEFNNQLGEATIIGGIGGEGFKGKTVVTKLLFVAKSAGISEILLSESSKLLRISDGTDLLDSRVGVEIQVSSNQVAQTLSVTPTPTTRPTSPRQTALTVTSPKKGETFSYNKGVPIQWNASNIEKISINLYLNEEFLGRIVNLVPNTGVYNWTPSSSLAIVYINQDNAFQVEVVGQTRNLETVSDFNDGPFSIITEENITQNVIKSETAFDINQDSKIDLLDMSLLLSSFSKKGESNADLNGDFLVNQIDFILLKEKLANF